MKRTLSYLTLLSALNVILIRLQKLRVFNSHSSDTPHQSLTTTTERDTSFSAGVVRSGCPLECSSCSLGLSAYTYIPYVSLLFFSAILPLQSSSAGFFCCISLSNRPVFSGLCSYSVNFSGIFGTSSLLCFFATIIPASSFIVYSVTIFICYVLAHYLCSRATAALAHGFASGHAPSSASGFRPSFLTHRYFSVGCGFVRSA